MNRTFTWVLWLTGKDSKVGVVRETAESKLSNVEIERLCKFDSKFVSVEPDCQGPIYTGLGIRSSLICSNRSGQMNKCERFAQVAQDKWATVSESFRSLMTNEQMWVIRSVRSGQMSEWANCSVFWANPSFSLLLTKNEQFVQFFFFFNHIFCSFLLFF